MCSQGHPGDPKPLKGLPGTSKSEKNLFHFPLLCFSRPRFLWKELDDTRLGKQPRLTARLLLFSRCWSTWGTEGRLLPARRGKVAPGRERRVRGSNGLKKRTITRQQKKCTESWYYWMKLRAEKFKHRRTAFPWNTCGCIPRKAVETSAWCVSKARLEQKPRLYQSSSYQLEGQRGVNLSSRIFSSLSLVSSVVVSWLHVKCLSLPVLTFPECLPACCCNMQRSKSKLCWSDFFSPNVRVCTSPARKNVV